MIAAAMDGTSEEVLERMRDNAGAFEHMQDRTDEKVNDGANYKVSAAGVATHRARECCAPRRMTRRYFPRRV